MSKKIIYGVDEKGNAMGEAHHRAKLSDADVELIRDIFDEGFERQATLAKVFGVSKQTIQDIVTFRRRAGSPASYRTVTETDLKKPIPRSRLEQLGINPDDLAGDYED